MGLHDFQMGRGKRGRGGGRGGPLRPVFHEDNWHGGEKPDYHTAALCKQVRRAVAMTLMGECSDEILQSLVVDEVLPAPNAGRLLVRVLLRADTAAGPPRIGVIDVLQRLSQVHGLLRARVGESIVRKRTPELIFDVIPVGPEPGEVSHE